ncbi:hypothetical protein M3661_00905 [Paenibacillus sp. MER 180]|uniref:hypothetical protein n=1 Tax=unclassified Paenibacillus TaxID=185978 RepID=UPI00080665A7|nr:MULTISPECIES: hypothetical protein [unclassified Paenibacillus]MCM3288691.1 hypothetical protein [Paenibacillus sp. MER 180]OBY76935.1 hypothetical protein BBG47_24345 [Paenibacillus sp. KS1]
MDLNRVAGRRDGNLLIHTYTIERIVQLVNAAGVIEALSKFMIGSPLVREGREGGFIICNGHALHEG